MNEISTALTSVTSALTEVVNIGNVAIVLGAAIGGGIVLYFGWFGIRKVVSMITNAAKGKLKI